MASKRKAESQRQNKSTKRPKVGLIIEESDSSSTICETPKKDLAVVQVPLSRKGISPILASELRNVSGMQFPALDLDPESCIQKLAALACKTHRSTHDLNRQQQHFGDVIRSPLPTATDGSMKLNFKDNYLLDDVDNTNEFKEFRYWVKGLVSRSEQTRSMGAVVQASGCGKSHFAKVFTRKERGIYLNFKATQPGENESSCYKVLIDNIGQLRAKHLSANPTLQEFEQFTAEAKSLVSLYFYCALEHYGKFLIASATELGDRCNSEQVLVWVGSFAFHQHSMEEFHRVFESKKNLPPTTRAAYIERTRHLIRALKVRAIFCDEINSLATEFKGQFLHDTYPSTWTEPRKLQNLLHEQQPHVQFDQESDFQRPTSLLYIIISVLKNIEFVSDEDSPISVVALTTSFSDFDITEVTHSTRDSMRAELYNLQRSSDAVISQFTSLVSSKFGKELAVEFKKHVPQSFTVRSLYMSIIWEETLLYVENGLAFDFDFIVRKATLRIEERIVLQLLNQLPPQYSPAIQYAAIFHNGVRRCWGDSQGFPCVPSLRQKWQNDVVIYITDEFLINAALRQAKQYKNGNISIRRVLEAIHNSPQISDIGLKGEDLMRAIAITNQFKPFSSLAVQKSHFPNDSIARSLTLDVRCCGDLVDFNLQAFDVLLEPREHLKGRIIKPDNLVKPDGLSISEDVITAWQCKYREGTMGLSRLSEALESLNYNNFFTDDTRSRKKWTEALQKDELRSKWTKKYLRIVVAKRFTGEVIQLTNAWNEDHLNHPVVLIQISDHLNWEPKPPPPSPVKSGISLYLEEDFDMFRL